MRHIFLWAAKREGTSPSLFSAFAACKTTQANYKRFVNSERNSKHAKYTENQIRVSRTIDLNHWLVTTMLLIEFVAKNIKLTT